MSVQSFEKHRFCRVQVRVRGGACSFRRRNVCSSGKTTTLLTGVVLLLTGCRVHLQFQIMRCKRGLRDNTKMLSTAEHKMRRVQLGEAPCYMQRRFQVPFQDQQGRMRMRSAGDSSERVFRSRQELVGIRRALLRAEDEENHHGMLLFAEFVSSSLTMAMNFALQCSLGLTEGGQTMTSRPWS